MCCTGFHEWWSAGSLRQNLVNCSGCAEISSVLEVPESLRGTVTLRRGPQLVLLKVRGQHRQGRPPIKSFPVCSYWILCVHAGLCRVESPSVCSGSSSRSFTWHIQAPCPSCWRRTTVCRTTTSDSHKDPPTSLCSGTHSCWKYIPKTLVHGLCGPDCDWWLGVMLQEVQLRDQGEGVEVALPEGWALPPAGQCWDHCAALPRHPQHKLPEQGEFTCPDVLTLTSQRTKWETVLLFVQVGWKLIRCSHVQLLADVFSEAVQNNQQTLSSVFQGVGVFGWLVVGEGLPTVRVLPVQRCQKHCSSFNLWLTPGDMGNTLTHLFLHFFIWHYNSADGCSLWPVQCTLILGTGRWSCSRAEARTSSVTDRPSNLLRRRMQFRTVTCRAAVNVWLPLEAFSELVGLSVVPSTDALNPRIFVLTPRWSDTRPSVLRELETTAHMTSGVEVRGTEKWLFDSL